MKKIIFIFLSLFLFSCQFDCVNCHVSSNHIECSLGNVLCYLNDLNSDNVTSVEHHSYIQGNSMKSIERSKDKNDIDIFISTLRDFKIYKYDKKVCNTCIDNGVKKSQPMVIWLDTCIINTKDQTYEFIIDNLQFEYEGVEYRLFDDIKINMDIKELTWMFMFDDPKIIITDGINEQEYDNIFLYAEFTFMNISPIDDYKFIIRFYWGNELYIYDETHFYYKDNEVRNTLYTITNEYNFSFLFD